MSKPFSIKERIKSFRYAFQGIGTLLKEEHNFRVHLVASILVVTVGILLNVSDQDWCWLLLCIGLVFTAEAFNTAIEKLTDLKQPEQDPKAGKIKDIAAGAVLLTAAMALAIGLIIFWPYLQKLVAD